MEDLVRPAARAERGDDSAGDSDDADGDTSDADEPDEPPRGGEVAEEPEPEEGEPEAEASTPFTERDALLDPIDKELGAPPEAGARRRAERGARPAPAGQAGGCRRPAPRRRRARRPLDRGGDRPPWWTRPRPAPGGQEGSAGSVADLADELARSLTAPLRDRIDRSFAAADGNLDDVADRVRALYREWKGTRLTDTSRHYAAAAYARGVFDATPSGTEVHWVVDPAGGRCPDCDDNVLGGDIEKGAEFPTGHTCAPAHPGCRCLVLAANR